MDTHDRLPPPALTQDEEASFQELQSAVDLDSGAELPAGEDSQAAGESAGNPAIEWTDEQLERALAALLFASPEPLPLARLEKLLEGASSSAITAALERIGARLAASGLPFELTSIAGGWQLFTAPDTSAIVARLAKVRREEKVSPAALETLAVVAYRQPVTKAEVEAIRGVQVGPILRALVDRGLVRVSGRAEVPGHPLLYATTRRFLDTFGLPGLEELPRDSELVRD
jgi:segregation and condensation protein B